MSSVISATLTAVILLHLRICYTYKKAAYNQAGRKFLTESVEHHKNHKHLNHRNYKHLKYGTLA